jgi:hypothetical protein
MRLVQHVVKTVDINDVPTLDDLVWAQQKRNCAGEFDVFPAAVAVKGEFRIAHALDGFHLAIPFDARHAVLGDADEVVIVVPLALLATALALMQSPVLSSGARAQVYFRLQPAPWNLAGISKAAMVVSDVPMAIKVATAAVAQI